MTAFQKNHQIGTKISGTFSKLSFTRMVVKHHNECITIQIKNPHKFLPVGPNQLLCIHPNNNGVEVT